MDIIYKEKLYGTNIRMSVDDSNSMCYVTEVTKLGHVTNHKFTIEEFFERKPFNNKRIQLKVERILKIKKLKNIK
jgi:hypothetical protein